MTEFVDSFGIYNLIVGFDGSASIASLRNRWNGTGIGNACYCQSGIGPRGGPALNLPFGAALAKTFSHQATYIVGMSVNMSSFGEDLIQFTNCGQQLASLRVQSDGSILVYGNNNLSTVLMTTSPVFIAGTYAYLEFKATVTGTTNMNVAVEVQINGVSQGTGSGAIGRDIASLISNSATFNQIFLLSANPSNGTTYIADFYLNNGSGSTNTGFFGICEVDPYPLPNGDDSSFMNWIPLGGSGPHYSEINENPADGDASYVSSQTIGDVDSYDWQDIPTFVGTVQSVQLTYFARTDAEGNRAFAGNVGAGGTEAQTNTYGLSSDYIYFHQTFDTDPSTGVAWTRTGFNAKEFGLILVS